MSHKSGLTIEKGPTNGPTSRFMDINIDPYQRSYSIHVFNRKGIHVFTNAYYVSIVVGKLIYHCCQMPPYKLLHTASNKGIIRTYC